MELTLLVPVILAGYIVNIYHPEYFYTLHRHEGQLLYMRSLGAGSACLFLAFVIVTLLNHYVPSKIGFWPYSLDVFSGLLSIIQKSSIFEEPTKAKQATYLLLYSIVTVLVAFLWCWCWIKKEELWSWWIADDWKYRPGTYTKVLIATLMRDNPLKEILLESLSDRNFFVMLTMQDGKVYVGRVNGVGSPNEKDSVGQEINLVPIISGFRDAKKGIEFTTDYSKVADDIDIVLSVKNIVSATRYYSKSFIEFAAEKEKAAGPVKPARKSVKTKAKAPKAVKTKSK